MWFEQEFPKEFIGGWTSLGKELRIQSFQNLFAYCITVVHKCKTGIFDDNGNTRIEKLKGTLQHIRIQGELNPLVTEGSTIMEKAVEILHPYKMRQESSYGSEVKLCLLK